MAPELDILDPTNEYPWQAVKDPEPEKLAELLPAAGALRRRRERLEAHWSELEAVQTAAGEIVRLVEILDEAETVGDFPAAHEAITRLASVEGVRDDPLLRLMEAWIHTRAGDADSARGALENASAADNAEAVASQPDIQLAAQTVLAGHLVAAGKHAEALKLLSAVFTHARAQGRTAMKAHALTLVGGIYAAEGAYAEARDIFSRAVLLHQRAGDAEAVGKVYNNIGACHYLDEGHFVDAIPFLELGMDFVSGRADILVVLNALSNNIRTFEEAYPAKAPAGELRDRAVEFAGCIPTGSMRRLDDMSVINFAPVVTASERDADLARTPVVTGPLVFWSIPRLRALATHLGAKAL